MAVQTEFLERQLFYLVQCGAGDRYPDLLSLIPNHEMRPLKYYIYETSDMRRGPMLGCIISEDALIPVSSFKEALPQDVQRPIPIDPDVIPMLVRYLPQTEDYHNPPENTDVIRGLRTFWESVNRDH